MCKTCNRYVAKLNSHCNKCGTCTSKVCAICVKYAVCAGIIFSSFAMHRMVSRMSTVTCVRDVSSRVSIIVMSRPCNTEHFTVF